MDKFKRRCEAVVNCLPTSKFRDTVASLYDELLAEIGEKMAKNYEYLERRCAINEAVLNDLGLLVAQHLPATSPQLHKMGEAWEKAIDKLNTDLPQKGEHETATP